MGPLRIGPDPTVDRSVADRLAAQGLRSPRVQSPGDLFGRPAVDQTLGHVGHERATTGLEPPQMGSPSAVSPSLSVTRVVATSTVGVTLEFAVDRTSMAAQAAGDLGLGIALKLHSIDDISLVHGKMGVRHREFSVV